MRSRLGTWACLFSLLSYLNTPEANTNTLYMNNLRNTYCSNLFKDSRATWEGQSRNGLMDSEQAFSCRRWAQGILWLSQPSVEAHLSGSVGVSQTVLTMPKYHLMMVSLYPRLNKFQGVRWTCLQCIWNLQRWTKKKKILFFFLW